MTVEIWSDVVCPFCYIGKRRFENTLQQFDRKNEVAVVWKSFQLSPHIKTDPSKNVHQYLAVHKGISLEEARQMNDYVTRMAAGVGLSYNFDKAIMANSFNAHRFSHFAKHQGKQNEAEEVLFKAYFTDGKNIDNYETLVELGACIELDANELKRDLESGQYADEVRADIKEAQEIGVRGVPFFLFDRKYAISGVQETAVFSEALKQLFLEE